MRQIPLRAHHFMTVLALVAAAGLTACDAATEPDPPAPGLVRVTLATTGPDADAGGYTVVVADQVREVPINGTVDFPGVAPGGRSVRLADVAPNCSPDAFSRIVEVTSATTAAVTFAVECATLRKVVFWRWLGDRRDLFVMDTDGGGLESLTNDAAPDLAPAWSPDGAAIAFVSGEPAETRIHVLDADGSSRRQLTAGPDPDNFPSWSPDGSTIAFARGRFARDIYVVNADGSGLRNLTASPSTDDTEPAWSPDATRIAFERDGAIYVMAADGTGAALLAASGSGPAWSPDGSRIAFAAAVGRNLDVYAMNADGTAVTRLTNQPGDDLHPAWSPDGARIAYTSFRSGVGSIYLMKPDGTGHTILADGQAGEAHQADWKPGSILAPAGQPLFTRGGGRTRVDTDSRARWTWHEALSGDRTDDLAGSPARLTGDGRDALGQPAAEGSEYQGDVCGVAAKIYYHDPDSTPSGDATFDPAASASDCGPRFLRLDLDGDPQTPAVEAAATTQLFRIMQIPPGESREQTMGFQLGLPDCEILRFGVRLHPDSDDPELRLLAREGTGVRVTRIGGTPEDAQGVWSAETTSGIGRCHNWYRGGYVHRPGVDPEYVLPFRITVTEIGHPGS